MLQLCALKIKIPTECKNAAWPVTKTISGLSINIIWVLAGANLSQQAFRANSDPQQLVENTEIRSAKPNKQTEAGLACQHKRAGIFNKI